MTRGHLLDRIFSLLSGMVFRGANLDPMFAAADANDGDASSIWTRQSFALRVRDREAFDGRRL